MPPTGLSGTRGARVGMARGVVGCRVSSRGVGMPQSRVLDPGSSLLAFFGAELRRRRAAAGMSQDQLGHAINYSAALVGRVEIGERVPSLDFARRCDEVLSADGLFAHLRDSMNSDVHAFPGGSGSSSSRSGRPPASGSSTRSPCRDCCRPRSMPGRCFGLEGQPIVRRRSAAGRGTSGAAADPRPPKPPMLWAVMDEGVCAGRSAGRRFSVVSSPI